MGESVLKVSSTSPREEASTETLEEDLCQKPQIKQSRNEGVLARNTNKHKNSTGQRSLGP